MKPVSNANGTVRAIGAQSARGFAWTLGQSAVEKVLTAVLQLVLAAVLLKRDFGLIALTYTVTTFASLIHQFGIKQTLLQRINEFERWATAAFWISGTIALVASGITIAVAPFAARLYGIPELRNIIIVAACGFPAASLAAVPEVRLSAAMRFRFLASISIASTTLTVGLTLLFASALHWGAYSVILPPILVQIVKLPTLWIASGIRVRRSLDFNLWPSFFVTSGTFFIASLAMMATYVSPFSLVGRITGDPETVGTFYFMHQLSDQATRLIMANLAAVLLPALSLLYEDRVRQAIAFERAIRGLLLVGVPICAVQAVLAGPIIRCLLPQKYHSASTLLTLLSIFMIGRLVLLPVEAMLTAQKKNVTWLRTALVYAPLFMLLCVAGTFLGNNRPVLHIGSAAISLGPAECCTFAMTVALNLVLPVALAQCFEPLGNSIRHVWSAFSFPLLGSAGLSVVAVFLISLSPATFAGDLLLLVVLPFGMLGGYYLLARRFAGSDLEDIIRRVRSVGH